MLFGWIPGRSVVWSILFHPLSHEFLNFTFARSIHALSALSRNFWSSSVRCSRWASRNTWRLSLIHQAWGSDEEWDGVDDQQGKPHHYCTDHATIELTRLAPCEFRVRISPTHLLTDLLEKRPDVDAGEYLQINQSSKQKLRHDTGAMCHEECFFVTNTMSALADWSKCTNSDHR